ncbi:hypothetical protein K470DRAFT_263517 [Piedraia hortae CBS 480.64]|uniref:Uncharacterized protein n=1 Tax=Piedraia hortae CBS 480.64 TaxID=1314780 RepID=A0A6A7C2B8_9PEZI|nr:hypothetical protein K470DRAFT_263517 [Piedraia hortae CBS 480.64]
MSTDMGVPITDDINDVSAEARITNWIMDTNRHMRTNLSKATLVKRLMFRDDMLVVVCPGCMIGKIATDMDTTMFKFMDAAASVETVMSNAVVVSAFCGPRTDTCAPVNLQTPNVHRHDEDLTCVHNHRRNCVQDSHEHASVHVHDAMHIDYVRHHFAMRPHAQIPDYGDRREGGPDNLRRLVDEHEVDALVRAIGEEESRRTRPWRGLRSFVARPVMVWARSRGISMIPPRLRDTVATSSVTGRMHEMKAMCMDATMKLAKQLQTFVHGDRFVSTIRGLMMSAYAGPIKVMRVGLYPYEQDILHSIASALAYSPTMCGGSTPSVQVLAQAMAAMVHRVKIKATNKKGMSDACIVPTEAELVATFKMLLRCSYMCTAVGVAFVNCVPVPVPTMARKIAWASLFSEWLGDMIVIYNKFGYKMTIVSMGALASDSVKRTFSSYRGTNEMGNHTAAVNPAAISYVNVPKHVARFPITLTITNIEEEIFTMMDYHPTLDISTSYKWNVYPRETLSMSINESRVGPLARSLANHRVEGLVPFFINMAKDLFNTGKMLNNTASSSSIAPPGALQPMPEEAIHDDPSATGGTSLFMNKNESTTRTQDAHGPPANSMNQIYVGRNIMLAQLTDATGKTKTQQTIMVENMIGKLDEIFRAVVRGIAEATGGTWSTREVAARKRRTRLASPEQRDVLDIVSQSATAPLSAKVEVVIGTITETTSEFTRKKNPGNRYWRAPVSFRSNNFESLVLKQANVAVPYNRGNNYGTDYIYVNMPKFVGMHLKKAAERQGLVVQIDDDRLHSTDTDWWKTLNNCTDNCGIITQSGDFEPRDLNNIFRVTKKGVVVNVDYCVSLRLTKTNGEDLSSTDVFRVVLDCSRVALKKVKVDVEGPPMAAKIPTTLAVKDDVATDDLLVQLEAMADAAKSTRVPLSETELAGETTLMDIGISIGIVAKYLADGYQIVSTNNDKVATNDRIICVNVATWESCPAKTELCNTLAKRLDNKKGNRFQQLSAVAICALCTHGYLINHISAPGLTAKDMDTVWGFMETTAVSSSEALSKWLSETIAGRSLDGYRASAVIENNSGHCCSDNYRPRNTLRKPVGATELVDINAAASEYGTGDSITSLAMADTDMLCSLRFNNGEPPPRVTGPTWCTLQHGQRLNEQRP